MTEAQYTIKIASIMTRYINGDLSHFEYARQYKFFVQEYELNVLLGRIKQA